MARSGVVQRRMARIIWWCVAGQVIVGLGKEKILGLLWQGIARQGVACSGKVK